MSRPACLLWVQSLLGSGHLRRAMRLAEALAASGIEVTLANGGPVPLWPTPPGVRLLQLPSVTAPAHDLAALVGEDGAPAGPELWCRRSERLALGLRDLRPDLVITEMFPFGRRAFRAELLPLLREARLRRPRPLVLASVRDVLVSKRDPGRYGWMREVCDTFYDAVLVHGDPALFPFRLSFPPADALAVPVLPTGFVVAAQPPPVPAGVPGVLVSAGGGAVGAGLLETALEARPLTRLAGLPWLLVAGGNLPPAAYDRLAARSGPPVTLVRHRPDLAGLLGRAEVSVSQAGYNTVAEGLAGGARMVLVPFAEGEEDEQTRRADRLAELGLALHLPAALLTGAALAAAIDRASTLPRPDASGIMLDGAERSAAIVHELLARRDGR